MINTYQYYDIFWDKMKKIEPILRYLLYLLYLSLHEFISWFMSKFFVSIKTLLIKINVVNCWFDYIFSFVCAIIFFAFVLDIRQ